MVDIYGYRSAKRDESYQKDPTTYRATWGNPDLVRQHSSLLYIGKSTCHLLICAGIILDHGQWRESSTSTSSPGTCFFGKSFRQSSRHHRLVHLKARFHTPREGSLRRDCCCRYGKLVQLHHLRSHWRSRLWRIFWMSWAWLASPLDFVLIWIRQNDFSLSGVRENTSVIGPVCEWRHLSISSKWLKKSSRI